MKKTLTALLVCVMVALSGTAYGDFVNGDFEAGLVGFGSDYTQINANTGPSQYTVTSTPSLWKAGLSDPTGKGQMLVADGATTGGSRVWTESVALTAGVEYFVSFSAASLTSAGSEYADLGLWVKEDAFTTTKLVGATLDGSSLGLWTSSSPIASFTPTSSGSFEFFIGNLNTAATGNIFAIDDITIVPEPSSFILLGLGSLIGFCVYRRRRKSA